MMSTRTATVARRFRFLLWVALAAPCGCGDDDGVDSDEEARLAYLGVDGGIDRAIKLGFDGFNAASSANIPPQDEPAAVSGSMTVSGQVDQGASNNKEMRLDVALVAYSDGPIEGEIEILYDTGAPIDLDMSMKGLPEADLTGTFMGEVAMSGAVEGPLYLDLSISGETEEAADGTIRRRAGTVRVTGTADSPNGTYLVDVVY
jgi:hypothetical protein